MQLHIGEKMAKLVDRTSPDFEKFELFTPSEVSTFLKEKVPDISPEVLEQIVNEKIDGGLLLEMEDSGLKEIAPLLGDRLKIQRAMPGKVSFSSKELCFISTMS